MARNLYDVGDARSSTSDKWLNERDERRARIVPRGALLLVLALGGTGALLFRDMLPDPSASKAASSITIIDSFGICDDPAGRACVLTPGRYAYRGRSYRIADVTAPDPARPACAQEAEMAQSGRVALLALMNGGAFEARPVPHDSGARLLVRDGVSLGSILVLKGHARPAGARTVDWCATEA